MDSVRKSGKAPTVGLPSGNKMRQFLQETWNELRYKVTWPDPKTQLVKSTSTVLAVVVFCSAFIYVLDVVFGFVLKHTILAPH